MKPSELHPNEFCPACGSDQIDTEYDEVFQECIDCGYVWAK